MSRSIPIRLTRASREQLKGLRKIQGHRIADELEDYRRQAARWAIDHVEQLKYRDPGTPGTLGARQCDVWRPLFAIADHAGGRWPALARVAATTLHGARKDEGDYGLLLLEDLREIYIERGLIRDLEVDEEERVVRRRPGTPEPSAPVPGAVPGTGLFTKTLIGELVKREDRPWPEYSANGKTRSPITPSALANLLKRFDVESKNVRELPGEKSPQAKGYRLTDLEPQFLIYLPPPGEPSQASQPSQPSQEAVTGAVTPGTANPRGAGPAQYELAPAAGSGGQSGDDTDYEQIERAALEEGL